MFTATVERFSVKKALLTVAVALLTAVICLLPMGEFPLWNGEDPGHRNQYELMTEAILDGRLHLEYGSEAALEKLENPYDPKEREQAGVSFPWDHAYYKGHYYMYFGVVPVFLAFLPFHLLTGQTLLTFHATQLFAAAAIAGLFCLFRRLARRFFPQLPMAVYLALAAAFSMMSVFYATAEPALYCTAITAAETGHHTGGGLFVHSRHIAKSHCHRLGTVITIQKEFRCFCSVFHNKHSLFDICFILWYPNKKDVL